ncbi:MAG: hypothetical protein FWE50_04520 [Alphaproteobacteria bacterium]|nr:hypothetical protein [Alphaproteobacteria bacterium]
MKKLSFLIFFIALFGVHFVHADDVDAARAAARGVVSSTPAAQSQRNEAAGRGGATGQSTQKTNTQTPTGRNAEEAARTASQRNATNQSVAPRSAAVPKVAERVARSATPQVAARSAIPLPSPAVVVPAGQISRSATRAASSIPNNLQSKLARSATTARATGAPTTGYKACRDIYFGCMDEFCANKNAQLKRCACSARVHEFDNIKKTLNAVEERMLDFNERLLAVNMDKEDAEAMSRATEGELAFQQKDKSESQKMLDTIMKKLQSSTAESNESRNLSAITLSMDMDVFDTIDPTMGAETVAKEGEALYKAALPVCQEMAQEVCEEDEVQTVQNAYKMAIEQDCNTVAKTYSGLKDKASEKVKEASALLDMSRLNNQQSRNSDDILTCKKKMLDALQDPAVCGASLGKCLDWSGRYINPATGSAILTSNLANLNEMIRRPAGDEKWAKQPGNDKFVQFLETKRKYIAPAMKNCESLESVVWTMFIEDALGQIKLAQGKKLEDMRQGCTTITTDCLNNAGGSLVDFDSRALSIFGVDYDRNVNQVCAELKTACTALMTGPEIDTSWGEAIGYLATAKTLDQIVTTCTEVGKNCIIRNCMNLESKFGLCQEKNSVMRTNIFTQKLCWEEVENCVRSAGGDVLASIVSDTGRFGTIDSIGKNIVEEFTLKLPDKSSLLQQPNVSGLPIAGFTPPLELYSKEILTGNTFAYPNVADADRNNTAIMSKAGIWLWCHPPQTSRQILNYDLCRITERIWGNCTMDPTDDSQTTREFSEIMSEGQYKDTLLAWFAGNTNTSCSARECDPGQIPWAGGCVSERSFLKDSRDYCPVDISGSAIEAGNFVIKVSKATAPNWYNCCKTLDGFGSSSSGNIDGIDGSVSATVSTQNCCEGNVVGQVFSGHFGGGIAANICSIGEFNMGTSLAPDMKVGEIITAVSNNYEETTTGGWQLVCVGGEVDWNTLAADLNPTTDVEFPNGKVARCQGRLIVVNNDGNGSGPNAGRYSTPTDGSEGEQRRNVFARYILNGSNSSCEYKFMNPGWGWSQVSTGTIRAGIDECNKISGSIPDSPPQSGNALKIVFPR